jgi:hypothetical protein
MNTCELQADIILFVTEMLIFMYYILLYLNICFDIFRSSCCYSYSAGMYIQSVPKKCVCPFNVHITCYRIGNEVV